MSQIEKGQNLSEKRQEVIEELRKKSPKNLLTTMEETKNNPEAEFKGIKRDELLELVNKVVLEKGGEDALRNKIEREEEG